jgi:Sulfotransferase family
MCIGRCAQSIRLTINLLGMTPPDLLADPEAVSSDLKPRAAPGMRKIFIFGSGRSGTTLLLRLFAYFADTKIIPGEHTAAILDALYDGRRHLVAKRTPLCGADLAFQLRRLPDVRLVDIVRDPREVITSRFRGRSAYHVDFSRWERDIAAAEEATDAGVTVVRLRFEDLVSKADGVQRSLAAALGLTVQRPFSDYPEGIAELPTAKEVDALGAIRPFDAAVCARWRSDERLAVRVASQVREHPRLARWVRALGYESNDEWIHELEWMIKVRGRNSWNPI